jgi:hypothetical protein
MWVCRRAMAKLVGLTPGYPLDVQSNFVAKTAVCISSLEAHGEQGGGKERAVKPTGQLPESCSGVHENDTHRRAGSSPLSDSSGSSHL